MLIGGLGGIMLLGLQYVKREKELGKALSSSVCEYIGSSINCFSQ